MSNPPKAKGTRAETLVVRWLRENGFPHAERAPLKGNKDAGDINVTAGLIAEVKNVNLTTGFPADGQLTKWMAETEAEIKNAEAELGYLVVKRKGTQDVGRWFCFTPLGDQGWTMTTVAQRARTLRIAGYGDPIDEEV